VKLEYYFFETSALAKRYKPSIEAGKHRVNKLYEEKNKRIIIANITIVEIIRMFYRCANEGMIAKENLKNVTGAFYKDLQRRGVIVLEISNNEIYLTPEILDIRMKLPGPAGARISPFDIIQIAAIWNVNIKNLSVISSDADINLVLYESGITVIDPTK